MTKERKKRILFHSDGCAAKTGFGRSTKALLSELYKTGKYEIHHLCCSMVEGDPQSQMFPWKSYGCLPNNQQEIDQLNADPHRARMASYGEYAIEDIVKKVQPDVYIGSQDIWGLAYSVDKDWFKNISSVIWTTLDSLPILPQAIDLAPKIKNYWIWANFATKELHRLGFKDNVKTVHGPLDLSKFYKMQNSKKVSLRVENNLEVNAFIIGFVFRNQLRKSVDKLLLGYKLWKEKYKPTRPTYLLLHTSLTEGWNIHKYCEEFEIDKKEILTTYICKNCKKYEIRSIDGQDLNCKYCQQNTQVTTSPRFGVTEEQLCEIYNLMNCYVHLATSGGAELPIIESASCELPVATTSYSFGESHVESSNGLIQPIDYEEYREFGTQFIKANSCKKSVCETLQKFYTLPEAEREQLGQKTRQWALDNFDSKKIAKFVENFIDEQPYVDYTTFSFEKEEKDPNAIIENSDNDIEWIKQLYKKILKTEVNEKDEGLKHWIERLSRDLSRQQVENYFRHVAREDNNKNKKINFEDFLDAEDDKKILFVMPDSIGDVYLCTSLFGSIKEMYPEYALYVATNQSNFDVLKGNPNIKKTIPYIPNMDQLVWLEGQRGHKGYFDIAFLPHITTQRMLGYMHNGKDKIEFDINKK